MKASNLACVGKCEKSAHQTLADAKQLLHHLDRLEAADHARHGAENAGLRARRHGAVGRRLWEQAAIVWARGAVLVRLEGAEGGELSVERSHRSRHQWELGQVAGIVEKIARGEIVRAVGDDVEAAQDIERVLRDQPRRIELRLHMRVEPLDGGGCTLGLGATHVGGVVHDLPLEIVEAHPVVVDDADLADARRGQIQKERRAETAGTDHEHARRLQALLAFAADLLQHQMAPIAFDFVFGEHDGFNLCVRAAHCQGSAPAWFATCSIPPLDGEAGRHEHAVAGIKGEGAVLGHGSDQVEARRMRRLIGGQRQAFAVRQTHDPNLHAHSAAERSDDSVSAARARRRAAISSLLMAGQSSVPAPVTRCTMVRSPPMMPVAAETSLATIQSAPLARRLARACSTTFSVSAAKPMTSSGRWGPGTAMVARMSGFWARFSETSPPPSFLSFCAASACARQSATAAAQTAMSAGSASRVASSISCAVSTLMTSTPSGSGKLTGPDTSVTRAPAATAARASAWPCLPEERLAM